MEKQFTDPLAAFNQLYKEMDQIYHLYAKRYGISDTHLWILYSLYESDAVYTQREFCTAWYYPPQTINSALKGLEKQGFISLSPIPGNQKIKLLVLTNQGKELTQRIIAPLVSKERQAFVKLTQEERQALLSLTRKYVELLRTEVD